MIKIDYTMRPKDEKELLEFLTEIGCPQAFMWQVPNSLFTLEVNGVDFSYHHSFEKTNSVLEFATQLKLYLTALEPRHRAFVWHVDGPGMLQVCRLSKEKLLLNDSGPEHAKTEVNLEELRIAIDMFCVRLYHEVIVRFREAFEFLNSTSSGRWLDEWIEFLMTPGDQQVPDGQISVERPHGQD